MKFAELCKGDWFTSPQDELAVFIKTEDAMAISIANHTIFDDEPSWASVGADPEEEVEFCSAFTWDSRNEDTARKLNIVVDDMVNTRNFADIDIGAIYKGKGKTWYRKISDVRSLVIWSENTETMGNIYYRNAVSHGTFSICNSFNFKFPEEDVISLPKPKIEDEPLEF